MGASASVVGWAVSGLSLLWLFIPLHRGLEEACVVGIYTHGCDMQE